MYNIQAYTTTVRPNGPTFMKMKDITLTGHGVYRGFYESVSDLPDTHHFNELFKQRKDVKVWMDDFHSPWYPPCQVLIPE